MEQEIIQQVKQMKPKKMKSDGTLPMKTEEARITWAKELVKVKGTVWNVAYRLQSIDHVRHVYTTGITTY